MAASAEVSGDSLVVHIEGADRLWAIKSRLEIPLANVVNAAAASAEARSSLHGIRPGGAHIPWGALGRAVLLRRALVFWDVHDADKAIGSSCATSATPGW